MDALLAYHSTCVGITYFCTGSPRDLETISRRHRLDNFFHELLEPLSVLQRRAEVLLLLYPQAPAVHGSCL